MYYKLETYDKKGLANTFESNNNEIVLRKYADILENFYLWKNKLTTTMIKCKVSMVPYSDRKEWKATMEWDDGVIYSKYIYYINLNEKYKG